MKCVSCGVDAPEGAHFCPSCGAKQVFASPSAPPSLEPEAPVWSGRYSSRSDALSWLLWAIFAGVATFAAIRWLTLSQAWMHWVYWSAVFLPAVLIGIGTLYRQIAIRYRLTSHRLFREKGILRRTISEIELMRVDDLSVTQNLLQRIFDVGVITLVTTDANEPRIDLAGILHPVHVKEQIRAHVQKRRSRSVNLESL